MLTPNWHNKTLCFFCLVFLSAISHVSSASHLIDVEIRAKPLNCSSRTYEITVIAYVKIGGVAFGGEDAFVAFGDGDSVLVPELAATEVVDPILNIGKVQFRITHTYQTNGVYILSYLERNRNEGIVNMDASGTTSFYTESSITISDDACDSSPYLTVPPIDRACSGTAYYHNPGAVDPDDDSVSFSFVIPKENQDENVTNYRYPNDPKFYTSSGLNYNQSNESRTGPPTFVIDAIDGTVTWDAPGATGEYALAIKITAWKFNLSDSTWVESGYSIRDMQVVVEDCSNQRPDLIVPADICVIAGTSMTFTVTASDPDNHPVFIEAFSDAFALEDSPAEVAPQGTALQSTAPPYDTAAMKVRWNTNCLHVKNQPYKVVFKVTDSPPAGPRLVRFKTISIKIIAPPPEFEGVTINPIVKKVTLEWKDYPCENVQSIQVWRRVGSYNYEQPECETGMPYFLRYTLLATIPGDLTSYTDPNLSIGAQYCYRIVALTGENKISSRISLDTCFIPQPAEAPVITNVSVVETHETNGAIQVRWTSPFDIDKNQYPPPYRYKVYRTEGFEGTNFVEVTPTAISDTTFVDASRNTQDSPYKYWIELYVQTLATAPIDTSSVASSIFLKAEPQRGRIVLTWDAKIPWYNYVQAYPYHLIYRSDQTSDGPFVLVDSVDVNEYGFQYIDEGKFQNNSLVENQIYYYKVLTRGSYGNPGIKAPLENFSQVVRSLILDSRPPCTPTVAVEKIDCSTFDCNANSYYNKVTWSYSDNSCLEEGLTYQIYVAETVNDEFIPLATTSENSFQHTNLNSMAKCYTVAAIDAAGNISPMSESGCNDNCPYFELPNVFTPGDENGVNDQFIAFGSETGTSRCARFVKQVELKVYNRWGMEIYSATSISPEDSYIFWDGTSNSGKETDSGVYFYTANVTFDVRDPAQQNKTLKGWVHVIRNH